MIRLPKTSIWTSAVAALVVIGPACAAADQVTGEGGAFSGLEVATSESLEENRGRFTVENNENTDITSVDLGNVSPDSSVIVNAGPRNTISSDSFSKLQGIATVVQNAASNVLINTTTEMTVNFLP